MPKDESDKTSRFLDRLRGESQQASAAVCPGWRGLCAVEADWPGPSWLVPSKAQNRPSASATSRSSTDSWPGLVT